MAYNISIATLQDKKLYYYNRYSSFKNLIKRRGFIINRKLSKDELYKLSAVEVYKMVLRGDLKNFPKGFWTYEDTKKNAIDISKYLIEEILSWSHEDIKSNLDQKTFFSNRLYTMLNKVYGGSPFEVINSVYPNKFKPWELNHVSK